VKKTGIKSKEQINRIEENSGGKDGEGLSRKFKKSRKVDIIPFCIFH